VLGTVSLITVAFASLRLGRTLRALARRSRAGGPAGSVIVGGTGIDLAVVGFLRPRVLVSAGALLELDDDELAAALAHERAHIARRHRYWMLTGEICAAIARVIPGSRAAVAELSFHLERDADRWALARSVERHALAAVLRKASSDSDPCRRLVLALGGSRIEERLEEILDERQPRAGRRSFLWRGVAAVLVTLVVGVSAAVPSAVAAGFEHQHEGASSGECD
jgi:beta-lactamase regulating signal transducer with metallopeptidase domain